jgi:hypothetical protein
MSIDDQVAAAPQVGIEKSVNKTLKYESGKLFYSLEERAFALDYVLTYFLKEIEVETVYNNFTTVFLKLAESLDDLKIFKVNPATLAEETFTALFLFSEVKNWSDTEPKEAGYNITISWITEPDPNTGLPRGTFPEEGSLFKIRFKAKDYLPDVKLTQSRFMLSLEDVKETIVEGADLFVKYSTKLSPLIDNGKPVTDN